MTTTFKAKTQEGYTVKVLSELLQNNVRIACLKIDKKGINMRMMDSHRYVLIDIELTNTNFNIYELTTDELYLGINLGHFYKMLKSIKKKDALLLSINSNNPDSLVLTVFPKENNRIVSSNVHIQTIQHIAVPLPEGYDNPVIIPSGDYQRTLKDMSQISDTITIAMKKYSLVISCTAQGIYSKNALFGELDDETPEYYRETFNIEQFLRILKISGLSKNLQMYRGNTNRPLLVRSQVGQLGMISIYIKSQEQIRIDNMKET
jgi:proliferating cell nuclear antigen PCNA